MNRQRKDLCIIVNQSRAAGRGFLQGIFQFAETRPEWRTHLYEPDEHGFSETLKALQNQTTDGIITSELENAEFAARLEASSVPLVVIGTRRSILPSRRTNLSNVFFDEEKIGAYAAQQILNLGLFKSFGYVGCADVKRSYLSTLRLRGFAKALRRHGQTCTAFKEGDDMANWISQLPKPAAIIGCVDDRAADVLSICDRLGITVPDTVRVLGIDNSATICLTTYPTLSSIATDFTEEGYAAAAELNRIMCHPKKTCDRHSVMCRTACTLVQRDSTRVIPPGLQLVNRAIDYVSAHADMPLAVDRIVNHLHVSKRLLYLRFKEFSDKSLHEIIVTKRLEALQRKLVSSRQSIASVTASCGFKNQTHVKTLFKQQTGCTISSWRKLRKKKNSAHHL